MSIEAEPTEAALLFGDRIESARRFTKALGAHGEERGLIGPLEPPRLWTRHILNSAIAAPLFRSGDRVGDIGSGAGLPGLVLAIARPDVDWVLIEPMERRVAWLEEQTDALGLGNVEIVRARGEEWAEGPVLDAVTARAVSALKTLIPVTAPLLRSGGELILLKGARSFRFDRISSLLQEKRHQTVMEIDLGAMVHNLNHYRSLLNNASSRGC